jgi:uncharacterized Zn-finger protein
MKNEVNNVIKGATLNEDGAIYVLKTKVVCEGSLEYSKHPKVYLKIPFENKKETKVVCPYCKQIFIYKSQDAR